MHLTNEHADRAQILDDIEQQLLSPVYVQNPYATHALLREHAPVYWCKKWGAWLITRHEHVVAALRDHRRFSNEGRYTLFFSRLPREHRERLAYLIDHYEHGGLVQSDPPNHTRLRRLTNSVFTPQAVAHMREPVEQIVAQLIAQLRQKRRVDLIRDFAFPLPAIVIAGMLGVPPDARDQFKDWSSKIQRNLGSGAPNIQYALDAQESWRNMNETFEALLNERLRHPKNDLLTALAQARDGADALQANEIVRTCGSMLVAGHETTTNLIASSILHLLARPDLRAMLVADVALYPDAVEEFMRFESPFQSMPRTVTEDVEFHGEHLRRGDLVYVMLGAANRDPRQFAHADQLDFRRGENRQIAFGHGIHMCLGAAVSRLETPIALQGLLGAFPNMRLIEGDPQVWKTSMVQRGLEKFPLIVE